MTQAIQQIITDVLPYTQSVAVAAQTIFPTLWTANYTTDVVVYYTPSGEVANDQTQILATNLYTVAFIGASQIVQVTLANPANMGDLVTIVRNTPADRLNLYSNTNFTPTMLNQDFGILTLVDQQAQLINQLIGPRYNYSALINQNAVGEDTILPILGANQVWMKNSANNAIVAVDFANPSSGGGINSWETISSTTLAGPGEGFVADNVSSPVVVTLPAKFNVGDEVAILGLGAGGWTLVANSGQVIKFGSVVTSTAGNIESDIQNANIFVRGLVANTTWTVTVVNSTPTVN